MLQVYHAMSVTMTLIFIYFYQDESYTLFYQHIET